MTNRLNILKTGKCKFKLARKSSHIKMTSKIKISKKKKTTKLLKYYLYSHPTQNITARVLFYANFIMFFCYLSKIPIIRRIFILER